MPLQVHLNLNIKDDIDLTDIKNLGFADLKFSFVNNPTTIIGISKLPGYAINNESVSSGGLISDNKINLGIKQSMFCWIYVNEFNSSSSLNGVAGQHRYASNCGMGITVKYINSSTGYLSVNTGNGSSRTYNTYCGNTVLQKETWYHVGYTYDGENIRLYVNGNLDGTHPFSNMKIIEDYIFLWAWSFGSTSGNALHGNFKFNGCIEDFRAYDHCLSAKEIKEISKGLFLHLPLDNNGMGPNNLLSNAKYIANGIVYWNSYNNGIISESEDFTLNDDYTIKIQPSSSSTDSGGYFNLTDCNPNLEKGITYTYSCWIFSNIDDTFTLNSLGSFRTIHEGLVANYRTIIKEGDVITANKWNHVSITFTATEDSIFMPYIIGFESTSQIIYVSQLKLEMGNKATPYTPSFNDLGVESRFLIGTEYDTSGLGYSYNIQNNGVHSNVVPFDKLPIYSSDTPRNKASMFFNGVDSEIVFNSLPIKTILNYDYTISFWTCPMNKSNINTSFFGDYPNNNLEILKDTQNFLENHLYNLMALTINFPILDNEWTLITITKKGNLFSHYRNGILEAIYNLNTEEEVNFSDVWKIGNGHWRFRGLMSDFRLYSTALSAEDVKELYNIPISLDNNANSFSKYETEEIEEDPENIIYNSKFHNKTDGWNIDNTSIKYDSEDSVNGSNGSIILENVSSALFNEYIEVDPDSQYKFEIDIKGVTITRSNYMCLYCYDANKSQIGIYDINIYSSSNTTLAQDLNDGDTVVHLNSTTGWTNSGTASQVAIIDSKAYGNKRVVCRQAYTLSTLDTENNTVTLASAWKNGKWLAGTPVARTVNGSSYIYPASGSFTTSWVHKSSTVTLRKGCKYVRVGTICYSGNSFKIANVSLKKIINSDNNIPQFRKNDYINPIKQFEKTGNINIKNIEENTLPVRYIRDYINGSSANSHSHWCEIQAYTIYGANMAYASKGKMFNSSGTEVTPTINGISPNNSSNTKYPKFHVITNNNIVSNPYMGGVSNGYIEIDLESIFDISKIIVWHYFSDGRTYNNSKTQVSSDGINWITVFDSSKEGTYPESADGHTIYLKRNYPSITKNGELKINNLYEN